MRVAACCIELQGVAVCVAVTCSVLSLSCNLLYCDAECVAECVAERVAATCSDLQ